MRCLRLLLSIVLATYMTGVGRWAYAQDVNTSPYSITLSPVQYASVKGNIGKFEALNWMPNGADEGISDITFIKDINKNISVDLEGSAFPGTDNYDDELTVKDGDLAFVKIDYKAFRKYFDNTGGVYPYAISGVKIPAVEQGVHANSPDLQMDIGYFKLETGLGEISDPFLDVTYEHDSKNGDKSLLQWTTAYNTGQASSKLIGPSYEAVNDTTDTITVKEKKDFAGVTFKADQKVEVDYNNNITYMPFLNAATTGASANEEKTEQEYLDAKLFGTGMRVEKWMLKDNTFVALGYHYNHTYDTDLMQNQQFNALTGALESSGSGQTKWSFAHASEDEHVWTGNLNSILTPDLVFLADAKYEHSGSDGSSQLLEDSTNYGGPPQSVDTQTMDNKQDNVGEHLALHYDGIPHTALYAETALEQDRGKTFESYFSTHSPSSDLLLDRLDRIQTESWTVGGKIVPNRFFIFTSQVKQTWQNSKYDTLEAWNPGNQTFLDSLGENGIEESSTLTWKPYHWIQNSLKYQFNDTLYTPRQSILAQSTAVTQYPVSENRQLTSTFTYDITVQPIDPLLLTLTYSHVEDYVRTVAASSQGGEFIPAFNSGDNSFLFSASYSPTEYLTWTSTVCYTIADDYVNFVTGVPYGANFKQIDLKTGIDWTYHQWLKIGPAYEYAAYKEDPLSGSGNYSANIFELDFKFSW